MESDPVCFLCKQRDINCTTLSYRSEQNSVEENLIEIYGYAILHYINNNQSVCFHCTQIINNMIRVKRQAYEVIIDNASSYNCGEHGSKVFNFEKLWNMQPRNLDNYSASPNDFLVVSSSVPHNEQSDYVDAENNYSCDTPFLDREVERVTSRSLVEKRSHNWIGRKSSSCSFTTKSRSTSPLSYITSNSRTSTVSRVSATSYRDKKQKNQLKRILRDFFSESKSMNRFTRQYLKNMTNSCTDDEDGDNSNSPEAFDTSPVSTRYANSIRQEVLSSYHQLIFECPFALCDEVLYSLEQFTRHQVTEHNEMAMYLCEACNFYYLTKEHLERHHQSVHYNRFISYCIFCAEKYTNKKLYEKHLDEHLNKSFSCAHCDKFIFLTKKLCEIHIRENHPGEKVEVNPTKPPLILDRIDKNVEVQKEKKVRDPFKVRILVQNPTELDNDDELFITED